ncbi:hypothetical protein COX24_02805 [bacterium (Candidatus Gribaldobacteria) CG23_combo_of_CG06-09_8_20_14_all_37_87_8]|uniref:Plasmid stabilization protein n=1 Tax=bacterium (Candidatus Gribaldobacteria) CG23_combo_of_CG06-09_8_20_14_all_37_87_8 TaxID=2014278 RepID=A0A2G9ZEI2_9BACT|nr:MAG: hypothetical protein AUJ25_02785 [Parcubacteria group bacterium CG1_02_37_13]PIP31579.1 MAG: hypothetical protein COX24_02805 [bacterium (Candidatus Gribaldobacteria) CG23_combo_of_CG06-09_8_20_14_all_37_87_8]
MLKVVFHPKASKELLKIPQLFRFQIINKIGELEPLEHPLFHRNIIKLKGTNQENFRLRVGDYRVKFSFDQRASLIFITHIQHRQVGY